MVILRQKNSAGTNVFSFKNKRYRGDLLIINAQGKLQVINLIDVEQYLYGVVGAEMGQGAPEEAYKAQAVVSRTYALFYKQHPQLYYDVGITTRWQVCGGYDAELSSSPQAIKAVDATRGQVIYYDGQIIQAFFHSNSGGYTEASENVWSASIPYIQPVATPEDILAGQPFQQEGWAGETFQWEKTLTRQQLNSLFANCNVGNILDLTAKRWAIDPQTGEYLTKQTVSGRVTQLDVIGERGTKSFFKDNIRTVLGLRSTLFEIISDSSVKVWNAFGLADECNSTTNFYAVTADGYKTKLNGNNVSYYVLSAEGVKTVPKNFTSITIKGRGNGHGLGMSQWGARGMALNGVKYRNILEHFYNQDRFDGKLTIGPYRP
jgi:stage II sporulation protein D